MEIKKEAKGKFIAIVGPSGAGKNTMINLLTKKYPNIQISISATTRNMREGEIEGVNYHFLKKEEFKEKIKNNEFLEYATYVNNLYGTLKKPIFDIINNNKIIINDIEYNGLLNCNKILPEKNFASIFFMPPSDEILIKRIKERASISEEEIKNRLESIKKEIVVAKECTYTFKPIDGDIDGSFEEFEKLILKIIK